MKRKYKRNIEKLRSTQGCMTDCVAFYFNLHPRNVPYFVYPREGWNKRFKDFFKRKGYRVFWIKTQFVPKRGTHLIVGNSLKWKTASHMVVYRNGKMVYDPSLVIPSKWKHSRMTHRLIVKKL